MSQFAKIAAERIVDDLEEDRPQEDSGIVRALPWLAGAGALVGGAYAAHRYLGNGPVAAAQEAAQKAGEATKGALGSAGSGLIRGAKWVTNDVLPGGALGTAVAGGLAGGAARGAADWHSASRATPERVKADTLLKQIEGVKPAGSSIAPTKLNRWLGAPRLDTDAGWGAAKDELNDLGVKSKIPDPKNPGKMIDAPTGLHGANVPRLREYLKTLPNSSQLSVADLHSHLSDPNFAHSQAAQTAGLAGAPAVGAPATHPLTGAPVAGGPAGPATPGFLDRNITGDRLKSLVDRTHGGQLRQMSTLDRFGRIGRQAGLGALLGLGGSLGAQATNTFVNGNN